jgi:aryl-alcohol dehydrogenase-like predicted oxidoreductase
VFTPSASLVWDETDRSVPPRRSGDPASVRREVEASLRTERIDLYQTHWPPAEPVEQYWQVLLDLKAEGKVRAVGLSNHDRGQLAAAEALGHVDSLQPPFSLINRAATDEIGWCHAHRTGVIVYSPMQSGLLTGAFAAARAAALPADDWGPGTRSSPASQLHRNLALVDALRLLVDRHHTTVGAVAIAWCLTHPGLTAAIVGARDPGQVDRWITAPDVQTEHFRPHRHRRRGPPHRRRTRREVTMEAIAGCLSHLAINRLTRSALPYAPVRPDRPRRRQRPRFRRR